ncbi:spore cortex biosynthesis protein YabQ [Aquibacillus sediminis]|uniref:spore cortex biosynthesis protein YabQ n=1 Tax=Aquibacillus sediminis TaxID=2574734 RepID=UPI001109623C|nr:spore cortex biosynthesis protein YabQ [Aquibacillus sediminis]
MTLTVQFVTIISMVAGGIYLGGAIETFKRFEFFWKRKTILSYVIEISFWLLQALILFYILYLVNQGELRFYILLALICGYATYKSLFENTYKRLLERVINISISIYLFIYRLLQLVVVKPIKLLIKFTIGLLVTVWGMLLSASWLLVKVVWYPIKLIFALIWRLLPQIAKKYIYQLAGFYSKIKNKVVSWWKYLINRRR